MAHPRIHLLTLVLVQCLSGSPAAFAASEIPETVIVTYQVKPGAEATLSRVIAQHWRVAQHLNLVRSSPHVVVQGGDEGKHYIVEILTWRDGSIPDNAPDAITQLWREMGQYVVPRDGRPGIDFSPVNVLTK
jgi:hypothetical protein